MPSTRLSLSLFDTHHLQLRCRSKPLKTDCKCRKWISFVCFFPKFWCLWWHDVRLASVTLMNNEFEWELETANIFSAYICLRSSTKLNLRNRETAKPLCARKASYSWSWIKTKCNGLKWSLLLCCRLRLWNWFAYLDIILRLSASPHDTWTNIFSCNFFSLIPHISIQFPFGNRANFTSAVMSGSLVGTISACTLVQLQCQYLLRGGETNILEMDSSYSATLSLIVLKKIVDMSCPWNNTEEDINFKLSLLESDNYLYWCINRYNHLTRMANSISCNVSFSDHGSRPFPFDLCSVWSQYFSLWSQTLSSCYIH